MTVLLHCYQNSCGISSQLRMTPLYIIAVEVSFHQILVAVC